MLTRRASLLAIPAALATPALARASALMPLSAQRPTLWADGVHDDAPALNALYRGEQVYARATGRLVGTLSHDGVHRDPAGCYWVAGPVYLPTTRPYGFEVMLTDLRGQRVEVVE